MASASAEVPERADGQESTGIDERAEIRERTEQSERAVMAESTKQLERARASECTESSERAEASRAPKEGSAVNYRQPTITLWATHRFVGFHAWPGASEERRYLADRHRHLFHARVEISVDHDDREIEFHDLFDVLVSACTVFAEAGAASCEQMASYVREVVDRRWPHRVVSAEISEDGEFGARCS